MNTFCGLDEGCWNDWFASIGAGTWPDWLAAIGTTLALGVAAVTFARDARFRHQAQARLVYSHATKSFKYNTGEEIWGFAEDVDRSVVAPGKRTAMTDGYGNEYVRADEPTQVIELRVSNASSELIGPVLIRIDDAGASLPDWNWCWYVIPPDVAVSVHVMCPWGDAPKGPEFRYRVAYRDAGGVWWIRADNEPISRASRREREALDLKTLEALKAG